MSKAIILISCFLLISCHNSNLTSGKIHKGEHIIIESILKSYNINGARARLDIYRDSLKLKLQLPILPIDILDLRINNSNIFIKLVVVTKKKINSKNAMSQQILN